MIKHKFPIKIVATILAKNEEDVIGQNIEHHISQGVSQFIITDNNSTDKTREIAARYPEVVEIIDETHDNHNQSVWVTRMARMACKLNPDWIIHLDADELWCGLRNLQWIDSDYISSTKMFLHPPSSNGFSIHDMRYYLDFEKIHQLPGESKVAHRPDPDVLITHGNHGFDNATPSFTKDIWRHHYPVRSYEQFVRKACGHEALLRRNSICERWKNWYDLYQQNRLLELYENTCRSWRSMIEQPNKQDLLKLLEVWSTPDILKLFSAIDALPEIGEWPRSKDA